MQKSSKKEAVKSLLKIRPVFLCAMKNSQSMDVKAINSVVVSKVRNPDENFFDAMFGNACKRGAKRQRSEP